MKMDNVQNALFIRFHREIREHVYNLIVRRDISLIKTLNARNVIHILFSLKIVRAVNIPIAISLNKR